MKDRVLIFDTTLRDGEQSPGASMTLSQKVALAEALAALKVDIIEAGFPITSPGDFEAVQTISKTVRGVTIAGLARAVDADIERAAEALAGAPQKRIHTFISTSPVHMQTKLKLSPDEVVARAVAAVKKARQYTDDVEFSAEDAGRSEEDFLCRIFEACIDAGATTINVPDTVGYNVPWQFGPLFERLIQRIPNADKAVFSAHCHDDLGMAVANSLSAVAHGARQIECTINGIGERAGNAALEEVVMALRTRQDVFGVDTGLDATQLVPCSKLLSSIIPYPVQPNKAIVGENAFAHESGIHQDGVLKNRETYEIMTAEDVGWDTNRLVLGKHSGRNALWQRLMPLLGQNPKIAWGLDEAFMAFKVMADEKHELSDDDLKTLIEQLNQAHPPR